MIVQHRYVLSPDIRASLKAQTPRFGFNGLGEVAFYRSYSRPIRDENGTPIGQEDWADVVIRCIEGMISAHKDTTIRRQGMEWDEAYWDSFAAEAAQMMFDMKWLPPGRGLWMTGTDYMYERGSAACMNCAYVDVRGSKKYDLAHDMGWITDMLMCGIGVGFSAQERGLRFAQVTTRDVKLFQIPDDREGWAKSVELLIRSYETGSPGRIEFDYSLLRPKGAPIKGFGGVSSGPEPLQLLHERIRHFCENYRLHQDGTYPDYTETRLIADLANAIGACVVAGNVRRSAEIMLGNLDDPIFADLKNWERFPERQPWMHLSNNSVRLYDDADFARLPEIASRIQRNGEPGFLNMINIEKYGRLGDAVGTEVVPGIKIKADRATGANPCSEISLESYETCCLAEVFPTRCDSDAEIFRAMEIATIYATAIQWLPTHRVETNNINGKNRRIGVSLSGIFDWFEREGASRTVRMLRDGYKVVRTTNRDLAHEIGMRPGIRVTTVKPSGTISKMAGCSSGIHAPEYDTYLRRVRIAAEWTGRAVLDAAGVPHEPDITDPDGTVIYAFPIKPLHDWPVRIAPQVSMWQQVMLVEMLQRHWADNMVSVTVKFRPEDKPELEHLLAMSASNIKSMSMMPIFDPMVRVLVRPDGAEHTITTPEEYSDALLLQQSKPGYQIIKKAAYPQTPEEPLTEAEYQAHLAAIKPFDWSGFISNDDGAGEKYCSTDSCEIDLAAIIRAKQERESAA